MDCEKGYVYELMDRGGPTDPRAPCKQAVRGLARMGYTQVRSIGGITGYKGELKR